MKEKLKSLKKDIDKYLPHLKNKYSMTPLISQSIEDLLEMQADDELLNSWYNSFRFFINDIKKEIEKLRLEE